MKLLLNFARISKRSFCSIGDGVKLKKSLEADAYSAGLIGYIVVNPFVYFRYGGWYNDTPSERFIRALFYTGFTCPVWPVAIPYWVLRMCED
jgi:hypothetical protein